MQLERAYDDFMTFFEKQVFSCLIFPNRKDIKAKSICKFRIQNGEISFEYLIGSNQGALKKL